MAEQEMWEMTRFQVGEVWPWEPEWVQERGFKWLPDSGVLLMVESGVTQRMCDDMAGPVDMALIAYGPLVGLMARFGPNWGWAESMVWRRPGQGVPDKLQIDDTPTPHMTLYPVLVDADDKRIKHMRGFTVSEAFTRMLYREVAERWVPGATIEEAQEAFARFEARYPTVNATVKGALARCKGGD